MKITDILTAAVRANASDVHLSAGDPPLARVDGGLFPVAGFPDISAEECRDLVYSLLTDAQRAKFEENLELDCAVGLTGLSRFRLNVLLDKGRVGAVLRVIPAEIPSAEALGLGPAILGLADLPRGLVLVTGPTGSGKTSTLACLINRVNQKQGKHVVTIEDPIEFVYPKLRALIRQREVGLDTKSFHNALREALREDPDVILVGEMRDLETTSLVLTAAETGHLCFSTLHTVDAAQTVDRIIDVFPAAQQPQVRLQLAGTLKAVVSQMLLPRKNGQGRIAARGLMLGSSAVANLIREGKTHMIENVVETGGALGMFTIDRALTELVRRGAVSLQEAQARAHNPERLLAAAGARAVAA